ncbi:ABC transporter substrate-binding protein [Sphingomonas edaphi]|uniref:ABC transporter substrate-binding protein n=2 Tax=Sphingomonas edaphi TaxID=2315689 RepID=A0A418Q2B4_9SPHN|nr:ABC transporter substrate-binding protein [Sphingomonas edaphi]
MNPGLSLEPRPMVMRFSRRLPLFVSLAALLTCAACGRDDDGVTQVGVIGPDPKLVETVTSPLTAGDALVRSNLAQGLVRFDERGQIVPGLAERWNVSDDGLSYIFRLQNSKWPDDRKIKANEIARILSRQLRQVSTNPLKDTMGAVTEVVAMTDRVIEMRLAAPRPNLLQLLAQPEFGLVRAGVGTGPFIPATAEQVASARPEEIEGGMFITHRIRLADAKDPIERAHIIGGDAKALVAGFAAGTIDLVLGGTVGDLPIAMRAKVPRGALRFDPVAGLFGLAPTRRSEVLQDEDVRQLLSRAIDRTALVAGLNVDGLAPRATLLQPGLLGIGTPQQPAWLAVPMEDRRVGLVAEANRQFGDTDRPTLRLFLPEGDGGEYLLARLRFDWAPLGIKVERAPSAASADLVWVDEVAPSSSPAWFLRRFRCDVAPICVEEAEAVLAGARTAPSAVLRNGLLLEAARLMDKAQLFIPIAAPVRWNLVSGRVPGFAENPFARHTLVGLANTKINAGTP